jgi:hypothetical protein
MGALVQIKASHFASLRAIVGPPRPRIVPARPVLVREPRAFPEASTSPALPTTIRDELPTTNRSTHAEEENSTTVVTMSRRKVHS